MEPKYTIQRDHPGPSFLRSPNGPMTRDRSSGDHSPVPQDCVAEALGMQASPPALAHLKPGQSMTITVTREDNRPLAEDIEIGDKVRLPGYRSVHMRVATRDEDFRPGFVIVDGPGSGQLESLDNSARVEPVIAAKYTFDIEEGD